ncbi:hypothetical protein COY25_03795 [Candidatus Uhrbacteria bacterium CG_4_10_14_0_2_um_filter_41_7]|uniref:Uncharacterized protein n=1 Tax=Candidatus Uhrbacteria bacterium CG_4_9_14_3_um_filter_41_35 TaxID=1975034 RepID=A0A2M7XFG0_9BACT|nr:MAG: hypothetical protein COV92_01715 [Candidatus Uhrbacteria bacterium CG11_big_fil_rev_8_21_14_0_20_41_9]PIZ53229.1 MAG: hypothetical protein COY25_03795 [Candidatus Uhrbacteria bacterium CG_4_10_14_0_2_um_filter_41_7]PJA46614.1 MAG: hypothetical protein CO173_02495 [Candidatus Uhrbacteria bacterium CG_4_9_14_3_um_filter_41_35]
MKAEYCPPNTRLLRAARALAEKLRNELWLEAVQPTIVGEATPEIVVWATSAEATTEKTFLHDGVIYPVTIYVS